ncbi:Protein of unknown function [Gryllus bimaculatus]|nr:Protein of unknown function [Gryllus bimaculatus]
MALLGGWALVLHSLSESVPDTSTSSPDAAGPASPCPKMGSVGSVSLHLQQPPTPLQQQSRHTPSPAPTRTPTPTPTPTHTPTPTPTPRDR